MADTSKHTETYSAWLHANQLRIGLLQFDTVWLELETNLNLIEAYLKKFSGQIDMVVLPEMFATGYVLDTHMLQKSDQEKVTKEITRMCLDYQVVIIGSIPYFKNDLWYNTLCLWTKDGLLHSYDKKHLFSMAGEHAHYTAGKNVPTLSCGDWKMAGLICYDLRFPMTSSLEDKPNIFFYVANWPSARVSHWQTLLKARAIENQAYVIGVNRTGSDKNGYEYPGNSLAFDFSGVCLAEMDARPGLQVITVDHQRVTHYRQKYPFLQDR